MQNHAYSIDFNSQLKSNLSQLNVLLELAGAPPPESARQSVEAFAKLDSLRQESILNNISTYIEILSQEIEPPRMRPNAEVARLKSALGAFGLKALDDGFFDLVKDEDVVEVYSPEGVQLYRNVRFCKICSYSLLDLAVNSWADLYEKPATMASRTQEAVNRVLVSDKTIPYDMPSFVQREKFIYSNVRRAFLVTPKFLSPLRDELSGRIGGFLSTYHGEILAEGEESRKFTII